jgi:hypothetical protein
MGLDSAAAIDVLVLGGAGVDTIVYVRPLPLPFADSYLVPAIEMRSGQTGDFVFMGLSALGLRAAVWPLRLYRRGSRMHCAGDGC